MGPLRWRRTARCQRPSQKDGSSTGGRTMQQTPTPRTAVPPAGRGRGNGRSGKGRGQSSLPRPWPVPNRSHGRASKCCPGYPRTPASGHRPAAFATSRGGEPAAGCATCVGHGSAARAVSLVPRPRRARRLSALGFALRARCRWEWSALRGPTWGRLWQPAAYAAAMRPIPQPGLQPRATTG